MNVLVPAFNVSLAITVFCYALGVRKFDDVRYMWHRPRLTLLSLIAMYILTPTLGLVLAETIAMPLTAKVAIVALSLSMIPPLLPQKALGAGGQGRYSVGLVIITALLAPIGIPALVAFLGKLLGHPYGVSPVHIGTVVLELVIAPLLVGVLVGWLRPRGIDTIARYAPKIASVITMIALVALLAVTFPLVWKATSGWILLGGFLFNVIALGIGHLMGGPDRENSIVLALSCASRHPAIALTIATTNYPGHNFGAAVIIVLVLNGVICGWYSTWQQRKTPPVPAAREPSTAA